MVQKVKDSWDLEFGFVLQNPIHVSHYFKNFVFNYSKKIIASSLYVLTALESQVHPLFHMCEAISL